MIYYIVYNEGKRNGYNDHDISLALLKYIINRAGINEYSICKEEHGKPFLEGNPFYFSISHTTGFCGIAVSANKIGFDAERKNRKITDKLLNRISTRDESTCIKDDEGAVRLWVMKEAYAKYSGKGIMQILNGIELDYNAMSSKDGVLKLSIYEYDDIVMAVCQEERFSHELLRIDLKDIESYL